MAETVPHISKAQVKWVRSLQQKKVRDAEGVFVAEGDKCIGELMGAFELVLRVDVDGDVDVNGKRVMATRTEIEQMSGMRTPQGSIAVFRKPSTSSGEATTSSEATSSGTATTSTLILALDGIQDPGNLGTIIRTCDWFGIRDIYCSRETADCYNPKVVQATMGALARVHIHYVDLVEWINHQSSIINHKSSINIYGTLLDGRNMYEKDAIPDKQNGIIIMGNEGNGISPEVRQLITHPLYIPSHNDNENDDDDENDNGTVESLNVSIATAIILAEFRRG